MGREANSRKERICKACHQSIYGSAGDIREHVSTCARLKALNLVAPGLITGQQAVDAIRKARDQMVTQKHKRLPPRWFVTRRR